MRLHFSALIFLLVSIAVSQSPIKFARFPAPSPDGSQIAFSWQGDIWTAPMTGGEAKRLTVNTAYDYAPAWSHDGKMIAFSSNRMGNDDVFVLTLASGELRQLTYYSGRDRVMSWTSDNSAVLFTSERDWEPFGYTLSLYAAPLSGGTPYRVHSAPSDYHMLSPDGTKVAFNRRGSPWWRKHYRGSAASDLYVADLKTQMHRKLTDFDGQDGFPMWAPDGQTLYYLSERDGTYNIWRVSANGGNSTQVTRFKDDGPRNPRLSTNGSAMVFEQGLDLWALSLPSGQPRKIDVKAYGDVRQAQMVHRTMTSGANQFAIAPNGKEVAFIVRGELFATRFPAGGTTKRLTDTVREETGLAWSSDSKTIYFSSNRDGNFDLYSLTSDSEAEARLRRTEAYRLDRLTSGPGHKWDPVLSPDGKSLAYVIDRARLMVMDLETKNSRLVIEGASIDNVQWSPDGNWFVYTNDDNEYNTDVYIVASAGGKPYNISQHPDSDGSPHWSADGRVITFVSRRSGEQINVYMVYTSKLDHERTRADREEEEDDKFDAPKKPDPPKEGEKKPIRVDLDGIERRVRQVTRMQGSQTSPIASPDGKKIAFRSSHQGEDDIYVIDLEATGPERRVTTGGNAPSQMEWSADGNNIYFISRGRISRVAAGGGTVQATNFSAEMSTDRQAENLYIFEAAWGVLDRMFYDPKFHGCDWAAMKTKYRDYILAAETDDDYTAAVYLMLGELNSSHVSFRKGGGGGPGTDPEEVSTSGSSGTIGVVWSNDRSGEGLLIERVLPDMPASREDANLKPGDRVLSVNEISVDGNTNVWKLFDRTVGKRTRLVIRTAAGDERTVYLRPVAMTAQRQAHYQAWIDRNRQMVERLSNGQLGYLHIRGMNQGSLLEMERELYSAGYGKKGLLIDVRYNGGGSTADMVMTMLAVQRHAYTVARTRGPGYPQDRLPLAAWTKPAGVLCNERSFSNAEVFSWAFKTLKRGPVFGWQTFGGVISTSQTSLMDGSSIGTPLRGWHVVNSHINLENNGCPPDFPVEEMPYDIANGLDRQLEKAVAEMLKEVAKAPPEFPDQKP